MNGDKKKLQLVSCLIAGVGLFLPLYTLSGYGESVSVSFMDLFDGDEALASIINSKIVLGVFIVAFIMLLARLKKDQFSLSIVSLLLIIAAGVVFYIDVDKLSAVKSLLSSMMKYGIGYYVTLVGTIVTFVLGVIDVFANSDSSFRDYSTDFDQVINNYDNKVNNSNFNNPNIQMINQTEIMNNNVSPNPMPKTEVKDNSNLKLSDLVSNNQDDSIPNDNK